MTQSCLERRRILGAALFSPALLFSLQPVLAQSRDADAALEALIPDAALDNPADWVGVAAPAVVAETEPLPDPATPLADNANFALPWPDEALILPELASLLPDADIAEVFAADRDAPALQMREGDGVVRLSPRLTLAFPANPDAFPEREAFQDRFEALSVVEDLSGKGESGIAQLAVRARSDGDILRRLLRIYGYYDAEVIQSVNRPPVAAGADGTVADEVLESRASVRFDIVPGVRYRFGAIDLGRLAEAGPDTPSLREAFAIKSGDPLYSDAIITEKNDLDIALGESGYAFAKLGEPDVLVDHRRDEGDLTLPVEPGGKYTFGTIVSNLPRYLSAKHLPEIARFGPGDIYKRSEVDDLRRAILATGLVSSVTVTPREVRAPGAAASGEVALDVELAKAPLRTIAGLAGYDSADGPRIELSWEHRNLFPPEGLLRVRGIAGTQEQLLGATFRRNNFKGRDQVLSADLYGNTVNRDAFNARTIGFSATFERLTTLLFQKPWIWSAGLELVASSEREGAVGGIVPPRKTYFTAALPLRAAFDASDNLLDPTRGWRAALRVSPEISRQGSSNATYARIQADASYYQPFGGRVVLAARARVGTIPGASIVSIAPSRRFFAGGGGSVRGYGYQQIGPRDTVGDPSGGRSLTEFSLEARVKTGWFAGALSLVPFIDAGSVDESITPTLRNMRYGAGVGVRYQTGFGPIRIDIGTPLNPHPGDSRIAVYVALGQAF